MIKPDSKNKKVFFELGTEVNLHQAGIKNALHDIGSENVKHLQNLLDTGSKTGRVYKIGGRTHQASAPGQAPATFTGKLSKSVDYKVKGFVQMEFGEGEEYGKFLETGTRNMKPRPHLITTVNDKERDSFNALSRAIGRRR